MAASMKFRRERKPNFSNAEIGVLLEGVYENVEVINDLDNRELNKARQAAYRVITDRVNKVTIQEYGGTVLRTVHEVKKKWADLKWTSIKVHNDRQATGNSTTQTQPFSRETPHTQLVLDILSGNVIKGVTQFYIGVDATDGHGLGTHNKDSVSHASISSLYTGKDSSGLVFADNESGQAFTQHSQRSGIKTELSDVDQSVLGSVTHSFELKKGDTDTFSEAEVNTLLAEYIVNRELLQNSLQSSDSMALKRTAWLRITQEVNKHAHSENQHTPAEVQKKWVELKSAAVKERQASLMGEADGRPLPLESPFTALVMSILDDAGHAEGSGVAEVQEVDFHAMLSLDASCGQESSLQQGEGSQQHEYAHFLPRQEKSSSFYAAETTCLLEEILTHIMVIAGHTAANRLKQNTWRVIARKVSKVNPNGHVRSVFELQNTYQQLKANFLAAQRNGDSVTQLARSPQMRLLQSVLDAEATVKASPPIMEEWQLTRNRRGQCRSRKVNFSVAESVCLINELDKHKHKMLKPFGGDSCSEEEKRKIWQLISEKINKSVSVSSSGVLQRTGKEVHKRWQAMMRSVRVYQEALEQGRTRNMSKPVLFERVMALMQGRTIESDLDNQADINDESSLHMGGTDDEESSFGENVQASSDDDNIDTAVGKQYQKVKASSKVEEAVQNSFTPDETECLLDEIEKQKHILLKSCGGDEHSLQKKKRAWQLISENVNKSLKEISIRGIPRTPKELNNRWKEMKSGACAYQKALEQGSVEGMSEPAYFHYVMNLIRSTKTDGQSSQDEMQQDDSDSLSFNEEKTGNAVYTEAFQGSMDGSKSDADSHDVSGGSVHVGVDGDSVAENRSHSKSFLGRKRKPNFSVKQVNCMFDMYEAHKSLMNSAEMDAQTQFMKLQVWQKIADRVSQMQGSRPGPKRTAEGMRNKWKKMKAAAIAAWFDRQEVVSLGRKLPALATSVQRILSIIGEPNQEKPLDHYTKQAGSQAVQEGHFLPSKKEPLSALVLHHMRTLAQICQDLKSYGLDAGSFIVEKGAVLSCGGQVFKDMVQLPQVLSLLNGRTEDSPQSKLGGVNEWEITHLTNIPDKTSTGPDEQAIDEEDKSSHSDAEQSFQRDNTIGETVHYDGVMVIDPGLAMDCATDGGDSEANIKDRLKSVLRNRSLSSEGHHSGITKQTDVKEKVYKCFHCRSAFTSLASIVVHNRTHKDDLAVSGVLGNDDLPPLFPTPYRTKTSGDLHGHSSPRKSPFVLLKKTPSSATSTSTQGTKQKSVEPSSFHNMTSIEDEDESSFIDVDDDDDNDDDTAGNKDMTPESLPSTQGDEQATAGDLDSRPRRHGCNYCGRRFFTKAHLIQHVRLHTGSKPYSCDLCAAKFTQRGGLALHKRSCHPHLQQGMASNSKRPDVHFPAGDQDAWSIAREVAQNTLENMDHRPRRFGCRHCGKRFFTASHRRQHERIHTDDRPYKCDICGLRFVQSASLTIHVRKHTGERPFRCDICHYSFLTSSALNVHNRRRHRGVGSKPGSKGDKFKCHVCGVVFPESARLKVHMKSHTGEKPFACDQCGRQFSEKHNLQRHKDRHLGIKAFQCEVCGAKFTEKGNLKVHMRYHSGDKPFKCEYCGEGFYVTSTLKIHRRKHTGERPFLCDLCGASFTMGSKLRSHRRSHTGEKPYNCEFCGEVFKEKAQLNIHQRKHTGDQPYRCSVCGKSFQKSSHLTTHMRLHTGEKPFQCEVCDEKFARQDVMKLHMKKHRPPSPENYSHSDSHKLHMKKHRPPSVVENSEHAFRQPYLSMHSVMSSDFMPPTMVPPSSMIPPSFHHMQ